jgi:hypothetical protein
MATTPPGVAISSTPPGATVTIDGRDAGYVTPCDVALDPDESHRVGLTLPGFAPVEMVLRRDRTIDVVQWGEGYIASTGPNFPLFLPGVDFFFPLKIDRGLSPGRIHARLQPLDAR